MDLLPIKMPIMLNISDSRQQLPTRFMKPSGETCVSFVDCGCKAYLLSLAQPVQRVVERDGDHYQTPRVNNAT